MQILRQAWVYNMKMECTYCGKVVDESGVEAHALKHFEETRGVDFEGQPISSRIEVNFIPVNR